MFCFVLKILNKLPELAHQWQKHNFSVGVFCHHCGSMLHGLTNQGMKCKGNGPKRNPLCCSIIARELSLVLFLSVENDSFFVI